MLGRVSEALNSVADVIAPPVTRDVDFDYHWKLVQHFYEQNAAPTRVHVDDTNIPFHLHRMLQLLVDEEAEAEAEGAPNDGRRPPCLSLLTDPRLGIASCLTSLAEADVPPGLRSRALVFYTSLLRRVKSAPVHEPALYGPVRRLLAACRLNRASPSEKEEAELLLTLCGLVRRQPRLARLFLAGGGEADEDEAAALPPLLLADHSKGKPKRNPLFEYDDCLPNPLKRVTLVTQPESPGKKVVNRKEEDAKVDVEHAEADGDVGQERFLLIDLLLSYLSSADNHIVLRACEGIMIVTSLPDDRIANLIANSSDVCAHLVDKLIDKYKALPEDTDPCDIDQLNITWGFACQEFADKCSNTIGLRETTSFLSWLDYCDTLAKECHPVIAVQLAKALRWHFFVAELELGLQSGNNPALITTVIGKCLKAIDSAELLNEICQWLVGDCVNVTLKPLNPIMQTLITNAVDGELEVCLETLRLFEIMIEKASEHILYCLVLGFVENRGYHIPVRPNQHPEDEERERLNGQSLRQERESNRETIKRIFQGHTDGTISSSHNGTSSSINNQALTPNIHHAINSFLLLLPRDLLSDPNGLGYEQYMQDAHRHYLHWVELTSGFDWPATAAWPDPSASSTQSYDSRPEVDLHMNEHHNKKPEDHPKKPSLDHSSSADHNTAFDPTHQLSHSFHQQLVLNQRDRCSLSEMAEDDDATFDEGPFLRTIFRLLANMPNQPYQINLQLTSIVSKLAMLPHPYLHEYLLDPALPTGKHVNTVFKILQRLSRAFMAQIPKVKRFASIVEETRRRLLGDDSSEECEKSDPLFESLIVVEEFCKELAAIYFVKYHHSCS